MKNRNNYVRLAKAMELLAKTLESNQLKLQKNTMTRRYLEQMHDDIAKAIDDLFPELYD